MKKIKNKTMKSMGVSEKSWNMDNWSFYRLIMFLTSKRGLNKLSSIIRKTLKFILKNVFGVKFQTPGYRKWLQLNTPTADQLNQYSVLEKQFTYRPKISILMPVYDPDENYLKEAIKSVLNQVYSNWELCIVDDVSTNENIRTIIKQYAEKDTRINFVFRETIGKISAASNSAIEIASGDFIALLEHDDMLSPDALYENILVLNQNKDIDFIYSDEDKIDENGMRSDPYFKPDWCPNNLQSRNYIGHFTVIKSSLVKKVGGYRTGYEGSQDFDLYLRTTEIANKIHHIPKILYHNQMNKTNSSQYIDSETNGIKALEDSLKRKKLNGKVSQSENLPTHYQIRYEITEEKKVSIIIPSKNLTEITNVCISSIFKLTSYSNFEVILVNNNSNEDDFFKMVKRWEEKEPQRFKCINDNGSFNFSRLMNNAVKETSGDYLLLLNNDTEVTHPDWMTAMVEYAQLEKTGVVGVKLLYHNDTIQHAGVVIGIEGTAAHAFLAENKNAPGYFGYIQSLNNFSAITAACIMVTKEKFYLVEGFDENLSVDYNDIDFCLKIKDKGFDNIYLPHVVLYHYESISRGHPHKTKESYERHLKEIGIFQSKWQKYIDHDPCYNPNLSKTALDYRINTF
jgi:GT2 family glycosyltransferase